MGVERRPKCFLGQLAPNANHLVLADICSSALVRDSSPPSSLRPASFLRLRASSQRGHKVSKEEWKLSLKGGLGALVPSGLPSSVTQQSQAQSRKMIRNFNQSHGSFVLCSEIKIIFKYAKGADPTDIPMFRMVDPSL